MKNVRVFAVALALLSIFLTIVPVMASAATSCPTTPDTAACCPQVKDASICCPAPKDKPTCCGKGDTAYEPSIDLGCKGEGNGIMDLMFAVIRFLSLGVGLVIVASMVYAGLQYIGSRGDPNANALAIKRIQANVVALLLFIFAYALINYVVPGQLLH